MKDLLSVLFSEISEEKEVCRSAKQMENKIKSVVEAMSVLEDRDDEILGALYEIFGEAEQMFMRMGFKYGVQMMIECHQEKF